MTCAFWGLSLLLKWLLLNGSNGLALSSDGGRISRSCLSTGLNVNRRLLLSFLWLDLLLGVLLILVDGPVKDIVVLEPFTDEEITEDLSKVRVIGLVIESKGTSVVEVNGKFIGESTAEDFGGSGHLLLHDPIVLLLLGSSLETLPGKGTTAEVEHDVSQGLHIITARLLWNQPFSIQA